MATQLHLISFEITAFILDRRASHRSDHTIEFYESELGHFTEYLQTLSISHLEEITTNHIRQYLIDLHTHRNDGGVHAAWRSIKAFIRWFAVETDNEQYINLLRKIHPPTPSKDPLPGVSLTSVRAMIDTCNRKTLAGQRDRSILTTLVDTGVRRAEFVKLNIEDVNLKTGSVKIIEGKGKKNRTVVMGAACRRELVRYLRYRSDAAPDHPLYTKINTEERLSFEALRDIVHRRAVLAKVTEPGLHDFRRTFAIEMLRGGTDLITLMHLMGHTTTAVLQRYLKFVEQDLLDGHERSSPADKL